MPFSETGLPGAGTLLTYATQTFSPAGIAETQQFKKEVRISDGHAQLTPAGARYAQPLAAFALFYSVEHNISVFTLLGVANSSGASDGPPNRLDIPHLVAEKKRTSIAKLSDSLDLAPNGVINHLDTLVEAGILAYETLSKTAGPQPYGWVTGKQVGELPSGIDHNLASRVEGWFTEHHQPASYLTIAADLDHIPPLEIQAVLGAFEMQGVIERTFGTMDRSYVWKGPRAEVALNFRAKVLDALQNGSSLDSMNAQLEDLLNHRDRLRDIGTEAIRLYLPHSPQENAQDGSERSATILKIVQEWYAERREGPRVIDVCRATAWHPSTTRHYIRGLVDSSALRKITDNNCSGNEVRLIPTLPLSDAPAPVLDSA